MALATSPKTYDKLPQEEHSLLAEPRRKVDQQINDDVASAGLDENGHVGAESDCRSYLPRQSNSGSGLDRESGISRAGTR